ISERQIQLLLQLRRLASPGDEAAVHANADRRAGNAEHERNAKMATDHPHLLSTIEKSAEFGDHRASHTRHFDRAKRLTLDDLRGNELGLIGPRAQVEIRAPFDGARARE